MKCKLNGKIMKESIESILLKGKWNNGANNKNATLCPSIVISVNKESMSCNLSNADQSTYVRNSIDLLEYDETTSGRISIDTEILLKYLPKEDCIFQLKNNILQLLTNRKTVKVPILERHENNDSMLFVEKNLKLSRNINDEFSISSKTKLETKIKVNTIELVNAFTDCEAVGNSVFKLDYDGNDLVVSSTKNNENVSVHIYIGEAVGEKATMEFSCPFYKHLEGRLTILAFNDESPLAVVSGNYRLLRAPRVEN